MKVLFLGGTGIISTACTELARARGLALTLLNRGQRPEIQGVKLIQSDVRDVTATRAALGDQRWDAVVDFIAFTPGEIADRVALFRERTKQYIFISSASAYQKPATHYLTTESTPLANPYWEYSRDKIACEELLMQEYRSSGFPSTVVRPSLTYGDSFVPLAVSASGKSFTVVDRMRRGLPVIVPGDGLTLWTITHNSDFAKGLVGLIGQRAAIGHAFHITSDEVLTWNQIYQTVAEAAGVTSPKLVHIASDFIAAALPEHLGGLLGDKANSAIFDNAKIKRFVPDFVATTPFERGIRRTIAWFDQDAERRVSDERANARWDRLLAAYQSARAGALLGIGNE
jgi:nucleoside-diphosphate-sugar epimerase